MVTPGTDSPVAHTCGSASQHPALMASVKLSILCCMDWFIDHLSTIRILFETQFLSGIVPRYDSVLILGEFNIHICSFNTLLTNEFLNLIDPKHKCGHTRDLVLFAVLTLCDTEIRDVNLSDTCLCYLRFPFHVCLSNLMLLSQPGV